MPGILNYDPESWRRPQRGLQQSGAWGATGLNAGFFPSSQPFQADPNMGRLQPLPYTPVGGSGQGGGNGPTIPIPRSYFEDGSEQSSPGSGGGYGGPEWSQPEYGSAGDWASTAFPELYDGWQSLNGWEKTQHRQGEGDPWSNVYTREKAPPWAGFLGGLKTMMGYTPGGLTMKAVNGMATAAGKGMAGIAPIQTPSVQTSRAVTTGQYAEDPFADMETLLKNLEGTTPGDGEIDYDYLARVMEQGGEGGPTAPIPQVQSAPLQMSEEDLAAALEQLRSEGYSDDVPIDEQEWARNWDEETGEEWWTRG